MPSVLSTLAVNGIEHEQGYMEAQNLSAINHMAILWYNLQGPDAVIKAFTFIH